MPGTDKPTWRVAIVLVLVVVAAVALRGYLPGASRAPRQAPTDSTLSLVAVVALLAVALAVLAFAVLARRPPAPSSVQYGPTALRGLTGDLRAKWVLIALGVALAWLLVVVLIARLDAQPSADRPTAGSSPVDRPAPPTAPEPPDPGGDDTVLRYLAAATVVLLVIVAVGTIVQLNRRRPSVQVDEPVIAPVPRPGGAETLVRAAELGLVEMGDANRDVRAAIIACYAAMERGLAHAPGAMPQDSDTPSEVLARAVDHHAVTPAGATELVELFTEARFSPHVMTEVHRDGAVAALRQVLADLRGAP